MARKFLDKDGLTALWAKIVDKINSLGDSLASVAFSGSYNDLSNKPTIPDVSGKVDKSGDTMTGTLRFDVTASPGNGISFKERGYGDKFEIIPYFSGTLEQNYLAIRTATGDKDTDPATTTKVSIYPSGTIKVVGDRGGSFVSSKDVHQSAIEVDGTATNGSRYDSIIASKTLGGGTINLGRISNEWDLGYVASDQSANNLTNHISYQAANAQLEFWSGTNRRSYIDIGSGNYWINDGSMNQNPSSSAGNYYGKGMYFKYADGTELGSVRSHYANSDVGMQWQAHRVVNNANYYNGVRLMIGSDGASKVWVDAAEAWRTALGLGTMATRANACEALLGELNHASTTGAGLSSDTGHFGIHWYTATGKIPNQPTQYGFLMTLATVKGSTEQHSVWFEQANGSLYHMGTNGSSSGAPPVFKKIYDTGNLTVTDVSYTRKHASVSNDFKVWRWGNVVTIGGYFSCGATIAANTVLWDGFPKPKNNMFFTWQGYDFNLRTDGAIRTNGQIIAKTYNVALTYVCT